MISIYIVDDHRLVVDGLSSMIEKEKDLCVLGFSHSGNQALKDLDAHEPDIVLLDLNMPDGDGLTVLPQIKKKWPEVRVLVVTHYKEQKIIQKVYKSGADGMFFKENSWSNLNKAIREVISGEVYMEEGVSLFPMKKALSQENGVKDAYSGIQSLTPREKEVLCLLAAAKGVKEIAGELYISQDTVSVHKKNIMKKLEVNNVAGMVKFAYDHDFTIQV